MPSSYAVRCRAIPTPLRIAIFAPFVSIGLLLGGYWWWMFTGPYQWLVNAEIALMGVYFAFYTGFFLVLFTVLLCMSPGTLIQYLLVRFEVFPVADPPPAAFSRAPSPASDRRASSDGVVAPESRRPSPPAPPDRFTS